MRVTLNTKQRRVLVWIAIWADRKGLTFDSPHPNSRGLIAMASAINAPFEPWKGGRGRPRGQRNIDGTDWDLPNETAAALYTAALRLGGTTPQQGVRLLLDQIWDAAPGIATDTDADDNLRAIDRVFANVNRRAVESCAS